MILKNDKTIIAYFFPVLQKIIKHCSLLISVNTWIYRPVTSILTSDFVLGQYTFNGSINPFVLGQYTFN